MITGPDGFIQYFNRLGLYDSDTLTEYFSTLSSIHGIITEESEKSLTFSVRIDNKTCPLLTFSDNVCEINLNLPKSEAFRDLIDDIRPDGNRLAIPEYTEDFDDTILAIYRFVHAI